MNPLAVGKRTVWSTVPQLNPLLPSNLLFRLLLLLQQNSNYNFRAEANIQSKKTPYFNAICGCHDLDWPQYVPFNTALINMLSRAIWGRTKSLFQVAVGFPLTDTCIFLAWRCRFMPGCQFLAPADSQILAINPQRLELGTEPGQTAGFALLAATR